jgi:hypothetical protein
LRTGCRAGGLRLATGISAFLLLAPALARAISCGEVLADTIAAPDERDDHAFAATSGDAVAFFLRADFDAEVELRDPNGTPLAAAPSAGFAGGFASGPLAASGAHVLRVRSASGTETGDYTLALVGPDCVAGAALRCAETELASVADGGLALHSFQAEAGDVVRIALGELPGTLASSWALVAPDASFVSAPELPLPLAGSYTIVASVSADPLPPAPAPAPEPLREFFLSPGGSDANAGTSAGSPWQTFGFALAQLQPGDRLTLLDGDYTVPVSGRLLVDCDAGHANGVAGAPITVRALNERGALIFGDGTNDAASIEHCSHWRLVGLAARNVDNPAHVRDGNVFDVEESDHIELKRVLAVWPDRYRNVHGINIAESEHVLLEDCEVYAFHRHGISVYRSRDVTVRRCYVNSRGQLDLPDGYASDRPGGDEAIVLYGSSDSRIESSIAEYQLRGFEIHGDENPFGTGGGYRNQVLGSVHFTGHSGEHFAANVDTRMGATTDFVVRPVYDNLYRDFVALQPSDEGFELRSTVKTRLENVTIVEPLNDALDVEDFTHSASGHRPICGYALSNEFFDGMDKSIFGGSLFFDCSMTLVNGLALDGAGDGLRVTSPAFSWQVRHSNFAGMAGFQFADGENPADDAGNVRHSMSAQPTGMGPNGNGTWVFVPPDSDMKGAGENGADIGANVLRRYVDGVLGNQPLWDPASGAFPCGAEVSGWNDAAAGPSCSGVHTRLGVTPAALAPAYAAAEAGYTLALESVSGSLNGGANGPPTPVCGMASDGTRALACGQTLAGGLAPAGDRDSYTFLAASGAQALVTIADADSAFAPRVTLFDPAGAPVLFAGGAGQCGPSAACTSSTLTATGTYTLLVERGAGSASGAYTLSLSQLPSCTSACSNAGDDDGDSLVDLADPGCTSADDLSEAVECADGLDNDGDGFADFAGGDPGCPGGGAPSEDPACDNGADDDLDGFIDADGGGGAGPDSGCNGLASRDLETPPPSGGGVGGCGFGPELALLVPLLAALRRRRR